jgi:hypothetical protein
VLNLFSDRNSLFKPLGGKFWAPDLGTIGVWATYDIAADYGLAGVAGFKTALEGAILVLLVGGNTAVFFILFNFKLY